MPILIDIKTGKERYFAQEDLAAALASGKYRGRQGDTYRMVDPYGEPVQAPAETAADALQTGAKPEAQASLDARAKEQGLKEKYSGGVQQVQAGLEGALRTLTFGLSDVGIRSAASPEQFEGLQQRREQNPGTALAGELLPVLLPGGLIGRAGKAAGEAVAGTETIGALAEGGGILGRAAARAVPAAATGTTEGMLLGAGQGLSEAALSNDPLTAEAVVSKVSSSALLAGGIGGVVGAGSRIVSDLASAGRSAVRSATAAVEDAARTDATRAAATGVEDLAGMDAKALREARKVEIDVIKTARAEEGSKLADEIRAYREEARGMGINLVRSLPKEQGLAREFISAERGLSRSTEVLKALRQNPGVALMPLQRYEQALDRVAQVAPNDAVKASLARNAELQERLAKVTGEATSPRLAAIEDQIEVLKTQGPSLGDKLGDRLVGRAKSFAGAAIGAGIGGPFGAVVGGLVPDALEALASRAAGANGKVAAVGMAARRFASNAVNGLASAAAAAADVVASKAARVTVTAARENEPRTPAHAIGEAVRTSDPAALQRAAQALRQITVPSSTPAISGQVRAAMDGLRVASPGLADKSQALAEKRLAFLASKAPPKLAGDLPGMELAPSPDDLAKFRRYLMAAEDPRQLVRELRKGFVSSETGETLRALYPEFLANVQHRIAARLASGQLRLSYDQRFYLSMAFGATLDRSLSPASIARMQQDFTTPPPDAAEGGAGAPKFTPQKAPRNAEKNLTPGQRLAVGT
jgi:hypothetical protein